MQYGKGCKVFKRIIGITKNILIGIINLVRYIIKIFTFWIINIHSYRSTTKYIWLESLGFFLFVECIIFILGLDFTYKVMLSSIALLNFLLYPIMLQDVYCVLGGCYHPEGCKYQVNFSVLPRFSVWLVSLIILIVKAIVVYLAIIYAGIQEFKSWYNFRRGKW